MTRSLKVVLFLWLTLFGQWLWADQSSDLVHRLSTDCPPGSASCERSRYGLPVELSTRISECFRAHRDETTRYQNCFQNAMQTAQQGLNQYYPTFFEQVPDNVRSTCQRQHPHPRNSNDVIDLWTCYRDTVIANDGDARSIASAFSHAAGVFFQHQSLRLMCLNLLGAPPGDARCPSTHLEPNIPYVQSVTVRTPRRPRSARGAPRGSSALLPTPPPGLPGLSIGRGEDGPAADRAPPQECFSRMLLRDLNALPLSEDDTWCRVRDTGLAPFHRQIAALMPQVNAETYLDLIRTEALAAITRAHRTLTGTPLAEDISGCGNFRAGIHEANDAFAPQGTPIFQARNSDASLGQIRSTAILLQQLLAEGRRLDSIPSTNLCGIGVQMPCPNTDWAPAQSRIAALQRQVLGLLNEVPELGAGHSGAEFVFYNTTFTNYPIIDQISQVAANDTAAMRRILSSARQTLSGDLRASAQRFCRASPDGYSWQDLTQLSDVTSRVLNAFPQMRATQQCLSSAVDDEHRIDRYAGYILGGACFLGAFAVPPVGGVCALLFAADSVRDFIGSREHLLWTEQCRAAGGTICTTSDYISARQEYEAAVTNVTVSGVMAVASPEIPSMIRQLRSVAGQLMPAQLRQFAAALREAREQARIASLLAEIRSRTNTSFVHSISFAPAETNTVRVNAGGVVEAHPPTTRVPREGTAIRLPEALPGETTNLSPPRHFHVTELLPVYRGENTAGFARGSVVNYLTPAERVELRLRFANGRVYDAHGNLFDTRGGIHINGDGEISNTGNALFVMDSNGNFYASTVQEVGAFHHSSLLAGQPVAAAGEIEVIDGIVTGINDKSGHYRPEQAFTQQAVDRLRQLGVRVREQDVVHAATH